MGATCIKVNTLLTIALHFPAFQNTLYSHHSSCTFSQVHNYLIQKAEHSRYAMSHPPTTNNQQTAVAFSGTQDNQEYGIFQTPNKQIHFKHGPLYRNQWLKSRFDTSSGTPEEITIDFMLYPNTVNINATTGQLTFDVELAATSSLQVWCIQNAKEVLHPPTNLTVKLKDYYYTHKTLLNSTAPSTKMISSTSMKANSTDNTIKKSLSFIWSKQAVPERHTPLTIILESLDNKAVGISAFMIYSFDETFRLVRQKYDWSSLSFTIQQIYGANTAEKNVKETDECVICMAKAANTFFVPCRHMCVCDICAKVFMERHNDSCPICRKAYNSLITYHGSNQ